MYFGKYILYLVRVNDFIKDTAKEYFEGRFDYLFGLDVLERNIAMQNMLNTVQQEKVFGKSGLEHYMHGPNGMIIHSVNTVQINRINEGIVYIAGKRDIPNTKAVYPVYNMNNLYNFIKDFFYFDEYISNKIPDEKGYYFPFSIKILNPQKYIKMLYFDKIEKCSNLNEFVVEKHDDAKLLNEFL